MGDLSANFSRHEFACKDNCGADNISPDLVTKLQAMRNQTGIIKINSGVRCRKHNMKVGGSETSGHLKGEAVDIKAIGDTERGVMIIGAVKAGFERMGLKDDFIHLDISPEKNRPRCWLYPQKKGS